MAYFARINDGIVTEVLAVAESESHRGQDFLANDLGLGGVWIQTSYNTRGGVHVQGGTPLRKNFAGIGYTYDEERDAFIPPEPSEGDYVFDEDACLWIEVEK